MEINYKFQSFMLEGKNKQSLEVELIVFMEKAFHLNGEENSYVDFYFSGLLTVPRKTNATYF